MVRNPPTTFLLLSHLYMEPLAPQADVREMVTPFLLDEFSQRSAVPMNPYFSTSLHSTTMDAPTFPLLDSFDPSQFTAAMLGTESSHNFFFTVSHLYMEPLAPQCDVREMVNAYLSTSLHSTTMDTPTSPLLSSFDPSQLTSVPQMTPSLLDEFSQRSAVPMNPYLSASLHSMTMDAPTSPLLDSFDPSQFTAAMLGTESSHNFFFTVSHIYMEPLAPQCDVREMVTPSLLDEFSQWSPVLMNAYLSTSLHSTTMDAPTSPLLDSFSTHLCSSRC